MKRSTRIAKKNTAKTQPWQPVFPEGKKCTNCGAHVADFITLEAVTVEIPTRTCYEPIQRFLCGHCATTWKAFTDLDEWISILAANLHDSEAGNNQRFEQVDLIPEDLSTPAITHRIRLLHDAASTCREVFFALGAKH
jgi:hypothetical protein